MRTPRFNQSQLNKISIEYRAVSKVWEKFTEQNNYFDNRQRANVVIKHSFMVACCNFTSLNLSEIGSIVDKDHASVIHARKNHDANMFYLPNYSRVYSEIREKIKGSVNYYEDVFTAEEIECIKELRIRLVNISGRLRDKIKECSQIMEGEPLRLAKENESLRKQFKIINDRNQVLNSELNRLKNLI